MGSYIARRMLQFIPVIFFCSVVIFVGLRLAPGDPAEFLGGPDPSPETIEAIRERIGLNKSIAEQYVLWLRDIATGDLGLSLTNGRPVAELIGHRLMSTLPLAIFAMVLSLVIGGVLGLISGLNAGSVADRLISAFASLSLSIPLFWTGIALILIFSVELKVFPVGGRARDGADLWTSVRHLFLPSLTLAIGSAPIVTRFLQSGIREVMRADHVLTARAKGLPRRIIVRDYIVRNSLIPVITASGIIFGNLIGGVALVEIVFSWPGIGSLLVNAMANRDYGVVQASILVAVVGFLIANLVVDILCGLVDPRVRSAQGG